MPINLHRRFLSLRPDKIVVHTKDEVKPLKLRDNQKKYHKATEILSTMEDWRFLELYKDGQVVDAIRREDVDGDGNGYGDLEGKESTLKLLVENNERMGDLFVRMYGDVIDGYAELASTAVNFATQAKQAEFDALRKLAKVSEGGNGEVNWLELIQHAPKIVEVFKTLTASGGNAAAIQAEMVKIRDLATKLGMD